VSEDHFEDMDVDEELDGFEDDVQDEALADDVPSVYSEDNLDDVEEYEEITSDEVDHIVETLEALVEAVESENIKVYLEDAVNSIHSLIYDGTELDSEENGDLSQVA